MSPAGQFALTLEAAFVHKVFDSLYHPVAVDIENLDPESIESFHDYHCGFLPAVLCQRQNEFI